MLMWDDVGGSCEQALVHVLDGLGMDLGFTLISLELLNTRSLLVCL